MLTIIAGALWPVGATATESLVQLWSTPNGDLQPEAVVDKAGTLHLISFAGDPAAGDLFYRQTHLDSAAVWTSAIQVNSQPASVIAMGTVRGGHLAVGSGRVHVAWMSADRDAPGMFYTRSDDDGRFEAQRNVTQHETGLDGGGSLAADGAGRVYVAWHAGHDGEPTRRLFVATSSDTGRSFAAEERANPLEAGACGCCGMRAGASADGALWILYRAATESIHRDMQLLASTDGGRNFAQSTVGEWELAACPLSTAAITPVGDGAVLAWETAGQIHWQINGVGHVVEGEGGQRKHPAVAVDNTGRMAIVWAEGTGWNRGGDLAWQVYGADGAPLESAQLAAGVAKWSKPAVVARPEGGFVVLH